MIGPLPLLDWFGIGCIFIAAGVANIAHAVWKWKKLKGDWV
jgi:hypothetical protein